MVTILSPSDGSYYTELVTISGVVSDDSAQAGGGAGEIHSLAYEIIGPLGVITQAELTFTETGSFSFQFATANIDGSAVVEVTAVDWNGNTGERSITLKDPGNDIPSFAVQPGNKEVTMSWSAVPGAVSYTVHYTTNGTPPAITYGKKVQNASSPLTITNLQNGNKHVFLLQAHSSNPSDLWLSDYVEVIPLSKFTLAPQVTGEYGQIKLVWNAIPATELFEVLRSTSLNGTYENISGIIETNSLVDTAVDDGQVYYYRVRPSFAGIIESEANSAETSPFTFAEGIELVGIGFTFGGAREVAVSGTHAFIIDFSGFLHDLDIQDPRNPRWLRNTSFGDLPYDVEIYSGYAYVASTSGLWIVDTASMSIINMISLPPAYGVAIDAPAQTMYVATATGVFWYNLTVPQSPNYLNGPAGPGGLIYDVSFDSAYVYAADYGTGSMHVLSRTPFMYRTSLSVGAPVRKISVSGDYAALATEWNGLVIVDITVPLSPQLRGTFNPGFLYATDVELLGSKAYVSNYYNQLMLVSIFDPLNPFLLQICELPAPGEAVSVSGNYAYVADLGIGLDVIDISSSTPDNPIVKQTFTATSARSVSISGTFAYVADGSAGLRVLDITNPETPLDAGTSNTEGTAKGVAVSGTYAFIADDDKGLSVIDLADLSAPVGTYDTPGTANDVAVSGHYAYVADGDNGGLQVIDISFPDDPVRVGFRDTPGGAKAVAVSGKYVFIADGAQGLKVIDVSAPNNPIIVGSFACSANDVVISGNYAYVADSVAANGLRVIDISFPNNLVQAGSVSLPSSATGVAISGNYAFVTAGNGGAENKGFQVIDITSPTFPTRIGACAAGTANAVAVSGSYAYTADGSSGGVKIIDLIQ